MIPTPYHLAAPLKSGPKDVVRNANPLTFLTLILMFKNMGIVERRLFR